jgi:hypothetical protein
MSTLRYGLAGVVVLALVGIALAANTPAAARCDTAGAEHELTLQGDAFSAQQLTISQCDTVRIVNRDQLTFELNFGKHDRHIAYPGFHVQLLRPGTSQTFTATQSGSFELHDHLRDAAHLDLTIRPR